MKVEVRNISKKFKNNYVLKNINLTFEEGKIYGLVGRNGSGKSVFLKVLCALYNPTEGEILYDGVNYHSARSFVPDLRALIEKPSFFPNLTGFENLKLLAGIQNKIDDSDILRALEEVNLIDEKDKKFSEYSLGMKQKLGVAQVIMEDPKILILDEPFNGIEDITVKKISKYLLAEKKRGKIVIVSSHIKEDLERITDVQYYFDGGSVRNETN